MGVLQQGHLRIKTTTEINMPLYVFQTSGNPIVRMLVGLAIFAGLIALAVVMLPVFLGLIGIVLILGLFAWVWGTYQRKKYGDPFESYFRTMHEQAQRRTYTEHKDSSQKTTTETVVRVETSDNKKWKMNDVEDIQEKR